MGTRKEAKEAKGGKETKALLKSTFLDKLREKKWEGGSKRMPEWACEGLAADLSERGREERRREDAGERPAKVSLASIENNPSVRAKARPKAPSDSARRRIEIRRVESETKVAAFRDTFRFRTQPFAHHELEPTIPNAHMLGVRAMVKMLFEAEAETHVEKTPLLRTTSREGVAVVFDPAAPMAELQSAEHEALFSPVRAAENALFNAGVTEPAPTDHAPKPQPRKLASAVSFNSKFSEEPYDPLRPNERRKADRVHKALVTQRLPQPLPLLVNTTPTTSTTTNTTSNTTPSK